MGVCVSVYVPTCRRVYPPIVMIFTININYLINVAYLNRKKFLDLEKSWVRARVYMPLLLYIYIYYNII